MTGIEAALTNPENIKAAAEKTEGLLKSLFGKAFEETGEMIRDQVRLRRFKNQVKILEKAKEYLKGKEYDAQKVNLKVLAPLIELSSLEEDENLQDKWAKLIKNIVLQPASIVLQKNAIEVLNKISNEEAKILDHIYDQLQSDRLKSFASHIFSPHQHIRNLESVNDFRIDWFSFAITDLSKKFNLTREEIEIQISNLVALGTLRYEMEVQASGYKKGILPEEMDVDVEVSVWDYESIRMTQLGCAFVELCRS